MEPNKTPSTLIPYSIPTTLNNIPRRITATMNASGTGTSANSDGNNPNPMALITEMLARYNDLIEENANIIKANKLIQDVNFAALQSTLGSMIQVMNGITADVANLEEAARRNAAGLRAVEGGIAAGQNVIGNSMLVQSRLDGLQRRVEANERDIASLKQNAENCSQTVIVMEGKLGTLDDRVSNIERMLSKARKKQQNEMVARSA